MPFSLISAHDIPKIIENIIKGIILLLDSKLAKSTTVIALTIWSNTLTFSIVSVVKVILTPFAISTSLFPSRINTEDINLVIISIGLGAGGAYDLAKI